MTCSCTRLVNLATSTSVAAGGVVGAVDVVASGTGNVASEGSANNKREATTVRNMKTPETVGRTRLHRPRHQQLDDQGAANHRQPQGDQVGPLGVDGDSIEAQDQNA